MALIVPASSWTGAACEFTGATRWIVLGPMAEGAWLRKLHVTIYSPSTGRCIFCPVLTSVGEPNVTALRAGRPLVQVGGQVLHGKPCLNWMSVDLLNIGFDLYVGLEIATDARWLVCLVEEQGGTMNATVTVSAELVRFGKGKSEAPGE